MMPVYNTEPEFLSKAIDSVLGQTWSALELLIYDDGSTREDTLEMLEHYERKDARVRVIRGEKNRGVAATRKRLLAEASYSLCANMDSDDVSRPLRLEKQVAFFQQHPDVGVCGTWFRCMTSGIEVCRPIVPSYLDFLREDCLGNPTVMLNKDLFVRYGLDYKDDFPYCEDYEIYSRAIRHFKIANLPEILLDYRERSESLSHANLVAMQQRDRMIHNAMMDFLTSDPDWRRQTFQIIGLSEEGDQGPRPYVKKRKIRLLSPWRSLLARFRMPVIVRLMGGLGNQMFQYAFGVALGEASGRRVLYDLSWIEDEKKTIVKAETSENEIGVVVRDYGMDVFGQQIPMAGNSLFRRCKSSGGLILEPASSFRKWDETLLQHKHCGVWQGYFQNEGYFKHLRPYLESVLVLPEFDLKDSYNQTKLMDIRLCDNSVFVHVRRGDFVALGWQLPTSYYANATAYMVSRLPDPHFFVFGDEVPEIMEAMRAHSSRVEWIGDDNARNHEDWKDMALMRSCRHAIIANSTFSWWAAWLGRAHAGIVTAPSPYMDGTDDGICDSWVKIPTKELDK